MDDNKGMSFLVGFLAGAIVGAAIAVLLTPTTGEENRRIIKEKAYEPAKAKIADFTSSAKTKAQDLADGIKDKAYEVAKDLKDRAGDLSDKIKKAVVEKKEGIFQSFSKIDENNA
jgi:gas vesicle protein